MTEDVRFVRAPTPVLVGALVLAVCVAAFSVIAAQRDSTAGPSAKGLYAAKDAERAERLLTRMATALLAMQTEDGGFHPGEQEVGVQGVHERLASTALATAALARLRDVGFPLAELERELARTAGRVENYADLDAALARGLKHLRAAQTDTGAIGKLALGPEQKFFQIDATSAALYAFVTIGDVDSVKAARRAGPALVGFVKAGLRNGWSRALAAMSVDRVFSARRGKSVFKREDGRVVKGRQVGERDSIDFRTAEAVVRNVLQPASGAVDAFPAKVLASIHAEPPLWVTMQSDMHLWWKQAWLVSRGAEPQAWFAQMVRTLEDEAILADGRLPGGYFADTLVQTACGILAILEGWA